MMAERDPSQHAIGPLRHGHCLESVNRLYSFKSKWVGSRLGISVGPYDGTIKIRRSGANLNLVAKGKERWHGGAIGAGGPSRVGDADISIDRVGRPVPEAGGGSIEVQILRCRPSRHGRADSQDGDTSGQMP